MNNFKNKVKRLLSLNIHFPREIVSHSKYNLRDLFQILFSKKITEYLESDTLFRKELNAIEAMRIKREEELKFQQYRDDFNEETEEDEDEVPGQFLDEFTDLLLSPFSFNRNEIIHGGTNTTPLMLRKRIECLFYILNFDYTWLTYKSIYTLTMTKILQTSLFELNEMGAAILEALVQFSFRYKIFLFGF